MSDRTAGEIRLAIIDALRDAGAPMLRSQIAATIFVAPSIRLTQALDDLVAAGRIRSKETAWGRMYPWTETRYSLSPPKPEEAE
jgi:hypothetical protein